MTLGAQANTEVRERNTWREPAATAVRRIDPRFPGSWMFSSSRQPEAGLGTGPAWGVRMTAATPAALTSCETSAKTPSARARRSPAGKLSTSRATAGSASALSLASTVSALPPLSAYARTRRSPSRMVVPVLRRSRDDPASLTRALTAGLLLERIALSGTGPEAGEDVAPVRRVEIAPAVGDEPRRRGEAAAAQDLVGSEPGLGIFVVGIADELRVGSEGARGPFPDVADHLPATAEGVSGSEPGDGRAARGSEVRPTALA